MNKIDPEVWAKALALVTKAQMQSEGFIRDEFRWIPHVPTEKQANFLKLDCAEALYGGAAGGGKSDALLMLMLMYADIPGFHGLLLRRTFPQLEQPGSLIPRSHEWLDGTAAQWSERMKQWRFPSGAILRFGHMETDSNKTDYQSSEFHIVGFDELTQFLESSYLYLFSRIRNTCERSEIPLLMRGATNPSNHPDALWVKERFIDKGIEQENGNYITSDIDPEDGTESFRVFVPAKLADNQHVDQVKYRKSLSKLDPVTRAQLLRGDWNVKQEGNIFSNYDERYHVIDEDAFKRVFQCDKIPFPGCTVARLHDWGTNAVHPAVVLWVLTTPRNSIIPGLVAVYRERVFIDKTPSEIAEEIHAVESPEEKAMMTMSLMSHEAKTERMIYERENNLVFHAWKTQVDGGITAIKEYFNIIDKTKENPFRPELKGRSRLIFLVNREEGEMYTNPLQEEQDVFLVKPAKTAAGLVRLRSEIVSYHWATYKSGEAARTLVPHPLYNDAIDCLRAAGMHLFPNPTPLNEEEKLEAQLPEHLQMVKLYTVEDLKEKAALWEQRGIEQRIIQKVNQVKTRRVPWL